jgi:transposase
MAGRALRVVWDAADTVEALQQGYRQEKDGEVRTRLHGLWLLRQGQTVGQVAQTVGVHYRTVQRWVRWYEAGGLAEVRRRRMGGHGQVPKLTAEQEAAVGAEVATGRFRTAADVGAWITAQYGVTYRPGGLYALLGRLKCAPKVPRPLHAKADPEAQEAWKRGA